VRQGSAGTPRPMAVCVEAFRIRAWERRWRSPFNSAELDKLTSDALASGGNFPDTTAGRAAFIRYAAKKLGIDPDYALSVAQSEGFYAGGKNHQNAQGYNVFGDFQLDYSRGVGVAARAAGIEPDDWQKSDLFALMWMKQHGMEDWAAIGHHGRAPSYNGPSPGDGAATSRARLKRALSGPFGSRMAE
jgi:hypothetical protein